jgi:hypothetical protein
MSLLEAIGEHISALADIGYVLVLFAPLLARYDFFKLSGKLWVEVVKSAISCERSLREPNKTLSCV